ncbi:aminoglycoside phosphotransferase family protein [Mycolicibacterium neoaurum]|uniref:aminoglycoside phosphotransferase family protein n=1 Tax=Mycolicibacterium neoaurum TaxID=1795 RepID=UPI00248AB015|nr:aminoglycoside phosphotransferase family protein [Mycolicibacterium neoaurum]WBP92820.1 aminoglycoside phosphotransferase family protein [Mycolicibacterium neoaurum]WBS07789.1 aminoglycoside phosphotransferase family protein [Mycolicibacterium neoaurum]
MHPGQLTVSPRTVGRLVAEQFPQWAGLPVEPVSGAGTVNAIFRIGDNVVARFPLEPNDDIEAVRHDIEHEAAAARELSGRTPVATPVPLGIGEPGADYPLPWSVFTWLPGDPATADNCSRSDVFATDLGEFIVAVRAIDTRGRTYDGNGRGGELGSYDEWIELCLTNSEGLLDVSTLRAIWDAIRVLPRGDSPDVMNHGDLIPPNVLTLGGRLAGVLDVSGFAAADPALDLVSAWHLLDDRRRELLRTYLGCDDDEWQRGRGWAFQQAMGAVWYYVDSNPIMSTNCRRTLERIQADFGA